MLGMTRTLLHYNPFTTRLFTDYWLPDRETLPFNDVPEPFREQAATGKESLMTVRRSRFGNGLFALQDIPKEQILFRITGRPIHYYEALSLGEKESYPIQVSPDRYILTDFPFYFINHSCDPNSGVSENLEVVTLRNIKKDEEFSWDYSTSMLERHWTMICECGSPSCRKVITDFDQLPVQIQKKYLGLKIVQPYIRTYLDRINKSNIHQHLDAVRNDTRRLLRKEVVH
jgi:uncharacterized protein